MLKDGGKFYLMDVVNSFDMAEYETFFDNWTEGARQAADDELAQDTEISIRDEYMTANWINRRITHKDRMPYRKGRLS